MRMRLVAVALALLSSQSIAFAQQINLPRGPQGTVPLGEDGEPLNLNFETGTLEDWTAAGQAWGEQPIKGEISENRPFGEGKKSLHTGDHWVGGYEVLRDEPTGTLTSAPFEVTHPWCSFLLGGGSHLETRVELVRAENDQVFYRVSGVNQEEMRPVVANIASYVGQKIYIRIVDEHTGGWGHVNFDDFRLYARRPRFEEQLLEPRSLLVTGEVYPHAGLDGDAAALAMQVPPGFSVQLAAGEPDVQQPIAMALDDRGRVWIAEAYEYPIRAEPGQGTDRILIFEDTDLDGTLDKRTVFAEKLNLVSGLEVGLGGVWVGAAPYLMFIPDRNGNDIPDGIENGLEQTNPDAPPGTEILLDGWHFEDTHETLNAFNWGPDGWLYGCHGVFTHSRVGKPGTPDEARTPLNAAIWRYHPVRHEFEIFAHGTSNPWGVDFDDWGQCFCTACVIPHLYHIIQGGRYQRQAGGHFNPHTYDDIKTIARHRHFVGNQWNDNDRKRSDDLGGGHAHAGAMFYLGGSWPAEYRNQLFMNNIHGNRVNVDQVEWQGSGYFGDASPDFLLTGDQWSQMLYFTYGPDGQVYAIDWYDANQCHRREVEVHDRSNGRIYRIAYNDTAPVQVNLAELTDLELARLANSDNDWYVRHGRKILQDRAATAEVSQDAVDELRAMLFVGARRGPLAESADPVHDARRLRALWALHGISDPWLHDESTVERLLTDASPWIRGWSIQLLTEELADGTLADALMTHFVAMAETDPAPIVRRYLASLAGRITPAGRWPLVEALTSHGEDAGDHNLPLLYWYAMEPLADVDAQRALALSMAAGESMPELRDFMVRRLGSGDPSQSLALLVDGLSSTDDDQTRLTFLRGIQATLRSRRDVPAPESWNGVYASLSAGEDRSAVSVYADGVGLLWGDAVAAERLAARATSSDTPVASRRLALTMLVDARSEVLADLVAALLEMDEPAVRGDALRAAGNVDSPEIAAAILDAYADLPPQQRRDALMTLSSRASYARELLNAVRDNRIARDQLSADLVRQLRNLDNAELTEQIEQVWGIVRDTPEDRARLITQVKALMESPQHPEVDRQLGRAVFAKTCQQCHTLFGTGSKIGPDITGSNRADLDYLLSNVVDPSAVMAKEYRPTVIATEDGRVVTGILTEQSDASVTVQTTNELITIPADDVAATRQGDKSMMPDDLLSQLSEHEIRSLVAYVSGAGQTPLLARTENVGGFFNGEDLTGWIGDGELWSVENGEIVGKSAGLNHNEFLVSELALEDFRFKCQVKLVDNAGNSGIQFRSQPLSDGEVRGYQADIGQGWWGKLYEERGRALLVNNDAEQFVRLGEWNEYEILAVGSRVQTWINGEQCVDLDDPAGARRGVIAVQLHSGGATEIRFRNLELELIDANPVHNTGITGFQASAPNEEGVTIQWRKSQLDELFRGEGVTVADFNNDGRLDISSGSVWFEQMARDSSDLQFSDDQLNGFDTPRVPPPPPPRWERHSVLEQPAEFNINGYSESFMNWAEDLNGDGRLDLIVVDFPGKQTWWFENPGNAETAWKRHEITPVTNNESPQYLDVTGDGRRELVLGFEGGHIGLATPKSHPEAPWNLIPISLPGSPGTDRFSHGLGAGDINGDGRKDVLITNGWWEQPEDLSALPWTFHEAPFGAACSQMYVFDYDGDADADVLSASAHDFGIWWHEQSPGEGDGAEPVWESHEIDSSYSETHAVCLANMNGDGLPDFVTGKRWWSHNGHGPGADGAAVLHWYELKREDGNATWTRHDIDTDSGVGTQFTVADVNADGLLDVVTSNKKGTFVFEQMRE